MRVRGLAFVGLVVGAFLASPCSSVVSATAVSSSTLDRFFSSDAPESVHEAANQGTLDEPKSWPEANAWLHASLSDSEREFLSLSVTGATTPVPAVTTTTAAAATTTMAPATTTMAPATTTIAAATTTMAAATTTMAAATTTMAAAITTTATPSYCSAHPTACLNSGTCINGASDTYTCQCASGFIGPQCQFSLGSLSKRNNQIQGGVPRGKSITRPNSQQSKRQF